MSLIGKIEEIVSGENVRTSGFYEPIDHNDGVCQIIDDENNLFLSRLKNRLFWENYYRYKE